jgi:diacylglycerol kinase family enzyme
MRPASKPGSTRRLAAVVALAAPAAAIAISLVLMVREWDDLLLLVISATVGTVATWYALTRRGLLRAAATATAVLAVGLAVLVSLPLVIVLVALLVAFALTGRYALGPDAASLFESGCRARPVGPARHGVLVVNPRSGDGKAARLGLVAAARARGIRTVVLGPGDDLATIAEAAAADGADALGMAGGDGSQALVASVAMRHGIAYVCVPSGTRNHFALDLGLDRADVLGALNAFTDAVERTVDLARVNGRVFVNNASLGVYAQVVRSGAYRGAKARTWGRMLPDLLGPASAPTDLAFDGPDARRHTGAPLVLVSNNPYRLARLARAGGRPKLDTGRLGIVAARVRGFGGVLEWTGADFEVHAVGRTVAVGLDGEALTLTPPLRFASLPGALRIRLPRDAPGARKARRNAALTRDDLTALTRVAAGRPGAPPAE